MKGISVWLFSKVVMLVFLLTVFATVLGFLKIVNEKVGADAAESLAVQIKDSVRIVLEGGLISATRVVPLPETLPEKSETQNSPDTKARTYSVKVIQSGNTISVAVSWENPPKTYVAASSFMTSEKIPEITVNSVDHRILLISKDSGKIQICGCKELASCPPDPKKMGTDVCAST